MIGASERRTLAAMLSAVAGLHVFGFAALFAYGGPIGIGVTAYTLGLRHGFDADHISAIDTTTRKLMAEGDRPLSVGFWFALGHSTIVFTAALAFSIGGGVTEATDGVGTAVSAGFLYLIAAFNFVILLGLLKGRLDNRGPMNRIFGRATKAVAKPRHMYPVGMLFGLGFDTASEVALLVIAGGAGAGGLPWYAMLGLPILFAAGMSLIDSIDGSFMNFAYGWALSESSRKLHYNLAVTGLSVVVALVIGTIEAGGMHVDIGVLGFVIVAMFAISWAIASLMWTARSR